MKKQEVAKAQTEAQRMLDEAGIVLGPTHEIEITDFGKDSFATLGLALIIRVSELEYASKWLVVFPGQVCPNHYHNKIKETFFIIKGDVTIWVDGQEIEMKPGDQLTMDRGTWHKFISNGGAVIEEVTNRQHRNDSIFEDQSIQRYVTLED